MSQFCQNFAENQFIWEEIGVFCIFGSIFAKNGKILRKINQKKKTSFMPFSPFLAEILSIYLILSTIKEKTDFYVFF